MRRLNLNSLGVEILFEMLLYLLYSRLKPRYRRESQKALGSHVLHSVLVLELLCLTRWPFANVGEHEAQFSEQGRSSHLGPPRWVKAAPRLTGPGTLPYQPHPLSFPIIFMVREDQDRLSPCFAFSYLVIKDKSLLSAPIFLPANGD